MQAMIVELVNRALKDYLFLIKLDVWDNTKITNVPFIKNLTEPNASWNCGINQENIKELNLIKLNV